MKLKRTQVSQTRANVNSKVFGGDRQFAFFAKIISFIDMHGNLVKIRVEKQVLIRKFVSSMITRWR